MTDFNTFKAALAQTRIDAEIHEAERERGDTGPEADWLADLTDASNTVMGARFRLARAKDDAATSAAVCSAATSAARLASIEATAARDEILRAAYVDGATARALADVAGISVPRVNQIVAGSRG